jgi:hypothetical protein
MCVVIRVFLLSTNNALFLIVLTTRLINRTLVSKTGEEHRAQINRIFALVCHQLLLQQLSSQEVRMQMHTNYVGMDSEGKQLDFGKSSLFLRHPVSNINTACSLVIVPRIKR